MIAVKCDRCGQVHPRGAGHRCGANDNPSEANDNGDEPPWKERKAYWERVYHKGYQAGYRAGQKKGGGQ